VKSSCLNQVAHSKEAQIFSQEQEFKAYILGGETRAQVLNLGECFAFSGWPTTQGDRWGSIYSPHLKKSH
jgi:hypothetical protein